MISAIEATAPFISLSFTLLLLSFAFLLQKLQAGNRQLFLMLADEFHAFEGIREMKVRDGVNTGTDMPGC